MSEPTAREKFEIAMSRRVGQANALEMRPYLDAIEAEQKSKP
jgi:hypothetical protein